MSKDAYEALVRDPKPGRPLVFAFHGTGGDESQFFELAVDLVDGAGVICPRGDVSENGALRYFRRTAEGVYDMQDLARATEKMRGFIAAFRAEHPNSPVYGFGYSNGANILASVFLAYPELFDPVGLLHPIITWTMPPTDGFDGQKVLVTAGRVDPITPWERSAQLIEYLQSANIALTTEVHDGGHEIGSKEITAIAKLLED